MKGVILAGGTGSRLNPLTRVTNKHLLPVYNKPMIYFPLFALKEAGITDIMIVSGRGHVGSFLELLGSGARFGLNIQYEIQEEAGGIAQALALTERFVAGEKFAVVLGDNLFEDSIRAAVGDFKNQDGGAKVFLKSVENPAAYGVATVDGERLISIVEKPKDPVSNLAVVGLYMYDSSVFDIVKTLKPSARNELEITDVNNYYLLNGKLSHQVLNGFWGDCGESFDSLLQAAELVKSSYLADLPDSL